MEQSMNRSFCLLREYSLLCSPSEPLGAWQSMKDGKGIVALVEVKAAKLRLLRF